MVPNEHEQRERTVTRKIWYCAFLAALTLLTACRRSEPDSRSGTKSAGASANSGTELDVPVEIVTRSGVAMISLPGLCIATGRFESQANCVSFTLTCLFQ